jgi:hypothetical protein
MREHSAVLAVVAQPIQFIRRKTSCSIRAPVKDPTIIKTQIYEKEGGNPIFISTHFNPKAIPMTGGLFLLYQPLAVNFIIPHCLFKDYKRT